VSQEPELEAVAVTPAVEQNPWYLLAEARTALGMSIADVALHLKLTPRQVEAMEAGELQHLPGPAFARGFVRNYARFLNLDPALFSVLLDAPRESAAPIGVMSLGQMPGPRGWKFSALPALGLAVVLLALAVAGWHFGWFEPRDEQYLADVMAQSTALADDQASLPAAQSASESSLGAPSPAVVSAPVLEIQAPSAVVVAAAGAAVSTPVGPPVVATAVSPPALPVAAASAVVAVSHSAARSSSSASSSVPKGARRLRLNFEGDAWVEVRDATGAVLHSRLNSAGSALEIAGLPPFELVVGNAAHVKLALDGKPVDLTPSIRNTVARLSLP
jgi:cytoskeleton protein RodZ